MVVILRLESLDPNQFDMEECIEGLCEDVHSLSARVTTLESTKVGDMLKNVGRVGFDVVEKKRSHRARGDDTVGLGTC